MTGHIFEGSHPFIAQSFVLCSHSLARVPVRECGLPGCGAADAGCAPVGGDELTEFFGACFPRVGSWV